MENKDSHHRFDRITKLGASLFNTPMCAISLVDADRQFFLSHHGFEGRDTAREHAFCNYVVADQSPLIVRDATLDDRFDDNPMVVGNFHLRFYPRLTGITNFFCLIYFISLDEKPPSGPTKIAPGELDDNSIFAEF